MKLPQSAQPVNLEKPVKGAIQELWLNQDAYSDLAVAFFYCSGFTCHTDHGQKEFFSLQEK